MSINLQGRKLVFCGCGFIAVLGLVLGGVSFWRATHENAPSNLPVATFFLEKAMRALPQWGRYQQLNQEIDELQDQLVKLGLITNNTKSEGVGLLGSQPPLDDLSSIFKMSEEAQRKVMFNASRNWQKALIAEMNSKVEERANQLQKELKEDISQQQSNYERKLKEYQQEIELDYALKLSDYEFKLSSPGLSGTEKALLNKELQSVKNEIASIIAIKRSEYASELEDYTKQRQKSISDEMRNYQLQLQTQFEQRLREKRALMEKEYDDWVNKERRSYQQKMAQRQKEHLPELLKLKSIKAEREFLRLQMNSTIRRKLKAHLQQSEIKFVFINPSDGFKNNDVILSFVKGKDITDELLNALR